MHYQPFPFAATACLSEPGALLARAAARQAVTATALAQMRLAARAPAARPFAPVDGAFAAAVARAVTGWKQE